jgi:hypothetical protein
MLGMATRKENNATTGYYNNYEVYFVLNLKQASVFHNNNLDVLQVNLLGFI